MDDHSGATIVRGADGTLYRLTTTDPPQPLTESQAQELNTALQTVQGALETAFAQAMSNVGASCTQTIKIIIPDVDL